MRPEIIKLPSGVDGFAEDKDEAKRLRVETILPTFEKNRRIVLDFVDIKYSTQSFIHALLGEALQKYGEAALDKLEFKNCAPQVKSLVQLVADYSLGGFRDQAKNYSLLVGTKQGASTKRPIRARVRARKK